MIEWLGVPVEVGCIVCVKQQPRAGTLEDRFLATEAGNGDVPRLMGKEPELVHDIERYWLDTVEFTSMHSLGSGTSLQKQG